MHEAGGGNENILDANISIVMKQSCMKRSRLTSHITIKRQNRHHPQKRLLPDLLSGPSHPKQQFIDRH